MVSGTATRSPRRGRAAPPEAQLDGSGEGAGAPTDLHRETPRETPTDTPRETPTDTPRDWRGRLATNHARRVRRRRGRGRGWRSPLTRRILALNILVLVIPVLGLLHLDQYRQSLIAAELDSLRIQAHAFALSLGSTAVVATRLGEERLVPEMTRHLMRVLLSDTGVRARIFDRSGTLVADSFGLVGPGGLVQVVKLPALRGRSVLAALGRLYDRLLDWIPATGNPPLYKERPVQGADDYVEAQSALAGEAKGMVRVDRHGRLVLSLAVPIQRYRQVLGALMVSKGGGDVEAAVRDRRADILLIFAVALAITVLLSFYLAGTIARPIRRLALAADLVRYGKGRTYRIPDFTHRGDEIGDLSGALRDMTEALWARLDAIEGFAADVAHEIKNPLTSLRSAVETVTRVEDPAQQKKLMSIILDDVERLDRLISDISAASRVDAELSRAQMEPVDITQLLHALRDAHNATADAGTPRLRLDIAEASDLAVQGIEDRLGQVFRNLIANATSFSPPEGTIWLTARRTDGRVEIEVLDEGPGLPENKLDAIFDRFYTERPASERFGTHSGLGLSISQQIVKAHGGTIRAENRRDAEGRIVGARFVVRLPAD